MQMGPPPANGSFFLLGPVTPSSWEHCLSSLRDSRRRKETFVRVGPRSRERSLLGLPAEWVSLEVKTPKGIRASKGTLAVALLYELVKQLGQEIH